MRPTLRNLLRLLDDEQIRSVEQKALQKAAAESNRAKAILKRLQHVQVASGTTSIPAFETIDAERLAQYLDGQMSETEIDEFEDSILASDAVLAHVRRCHQLLLESYIRKAVSVNLSMRERLYAMAADDSGEGAVPTTEDESTLEDLPFVDDTGDAGSATETVSDSEFEPISIDAMQRRARRQSLLATVAIVLVLCGLIGIAYWMGLESQKNKDVATDSVGADPTGNETDLTNDDVSPSITREDSPDSDEPLDNEVDLAGPPLPDPKALTDDSVIKPVLPPRPELSLLTWLPQWQTEHEVDPNAWGDEIGSVIDSDSIILLKQPADQRWSRMGASDPVHENCRLLMLNGGSAHLSLDDQISVRTVGQTRLDVEHRSADDDFGLNLHYGQVVLQPQVNDVGCTLQVLADTALIEFPDAKTQVSCQRNIFYPLGADPRSDERRESFIVHVRFGRCYLHYLGQTITLPADSAWMVGTGSPPSFGDPGDQIAWPSLDSTDRFAQNPLQDRIETGTDLEAQLIDLINDNRREVRKHAHVALITIGQFDYLLDFLNDGNNRSEEWRLLLQSARRQVQLVPDLAGQLFDDLSTTGPLQPSLFQLVIGVSPDQLESESMDERLVEFLDHPELAVRVLAIENLRLITDGKTYMYRADDEGIQRRRSIRRNWDRLLSRGEIRYVQLPQPPQIELAPIAPGDSTSSSENDDTSGPADRLR